MKPFLPGCLIFLFLFSSLQGTLAYSFRNEKDDSVKIGFLISSGKSVEAINGAKLAILKANSIEGNNSKPFKLIVRSMEGPWGTGSKQAVNLIFEEKVTALIGSCDGRNAHLVEQAAAKTRFVFISAWSSDPTLAQAFVPWYFSVVPNDNQQASALIEEIYNKQRIDKVVVVSDNSYDSKLASSCFVRSANLAGKIAPKVFSYDNSGNNFNELIDQIISEDAGAIVLLGQPAASAIFIKQLKIKKMNQKLFATINLFGENESAGSNLSDFDGVSVPSCGLWFNSKGAAFCKEYLKIYGTEPGPAAAYAYDAVNLIADAIRNGGTEYNQIKDSLLKVNYDGTTGSIHFDEKGNRIGELKMVLIKNGIPEITKKQ
jgi:branched-chain amino acid transport system substrate-binding protein